MKKTITSFIFILAFINLTFCKPIDPNTAKSVALNFISTRVNSKTISKSLSLDLVYTSSSQSNSALAIASPLNYFFVFNVNQNQGYIMVSADDIVIPVLGYSDEKAFDPNNIPNNVAKWFENYKDQIRFAISTNMEATEEISKEWMDLLSATSPGQKLNKKASVNPLVQTRWNQSPYYNSLCPNDIGSGERTVTGCVATAMAQVMKFWNYPESGTGFHSYNSSKYGTLSASFGSTTYNWSSMPNRVTSANTSVATLMYHCGVSVDMNYDIAAKGGSSAYVISAASQGTHCAEYALRVYFGYKSTMKGLKRNDYTDANWLSLVKKEFDGGRPVIYAGFGTGGGHCFVSDGYDNNDFLHFNWGWDGSYDGYFAINALNPGGTGTGGGTGSYNSNQQAVIGIEPSSGIQTSDLDITASVTPSASNINYGNSFSVSTNITNKGATTFYGTYCAALFDENNKFVEYIDSLVEPNGLPVNYTYKNNIVFNKAGSFTLLPGTYTVYIFYKPVGGNWKQIYASLTSLYDYATIKVNNASTIEMNADMKLTPTDFEQDKQASVNLNLINKSSITFLGEYHVNLYNLDGTFAEKIGSITESAGLPLNYTYQSPFLTFTNTKITSKPGTYLLAVVFKSNSSSSYYLVGSTNFQNPKKVTVSAPKILPDAYEINNTVAQAYPLSLSFTNNNANSTTTGSNCHVGTDYDYYKVVLPTGYKYTIKAELYDSYNDHGGTYTLDGLLSYSTDGTSWSDAFDSKVPTDIKVNGGTTVYFLTSPYFSGVTGNYLLDLNITRTSTGAVQDKVAIANLITLYPNPANDLVEIDLSNIRLSNTQIQVIDLQGKISTYPLINKNENTYKLNIGALSNGIYILQINTDKGIINKKLVVAK